MSKIKIIAEIGINHNGDIKLAKELIDVSVKAGCDIVKFQKRDIENVYSKTFLDSFRESPWGKTQRDQKTGIELSVDDYTIINEYCLEKKIDWFASCWDTKSQILMRKFNLNYNKVASPMLVHTKLLEIIADEKKHTFISTGMSEEKDIEKAVNIFLKKNCPFELMHCVSAYPLNPIDANLNYIKTLKNKFKCNVGYSGHETGIGISIAANRHKGIRAALCTSEFHAEMSRKHNDANVIAFGARITPITEMIKMVDKFLHTDFEGGRHQNRIEKIEL